MVITSRLLLLKKQAAYLGYLVNFQRAQPPFSGQFSTRANTQAIKLDPTLDEGKITVAMGRIDEIWSQLFPAEQARIVNLLVEKVIVSPNDLEVRLRANGIERLARELRQEVVTARQPEGAPA